tara:strand:- start:291 stop:575 length:285 start_codon:yes stop_codon:yes gene_type:complete
MIKSSKTNIERQDEEILIATMDIFQKVSYFLTDLLCKFLDHNYPSDTVYDRAQEDFEAGITRHQRSVGNYRRNNNNSSSQIDQELDLLENDLDL